MEELNIEERVARLEKAVFEGSRDAVSTSFQGHVVESRRKSAADALIAMGGTNPNATAAPRRREPDFKNDPPEPRRPVPKKQTQSTYGWSYRKGAFTKLNFAEHCAFYFTGAKNRLRQLLKRDPSASLLYARAHAVIKIINTEIYEKDVAIDTRKIMDAHDELVDLLRGHGTQGGEVVKSLEYMDKIRNLFE